MKMGNIGHDTLDMISGMDQYNRWIYDQFKQFTAAPILEIGSGIGNITQFFKGKEVLCLDVDSESLSKLRKRFPKSKKLSTLKHDVSRPTRHIQKGYYGSAIMLNVLEHVKDDRIALENINKYLRPDGVLILQVPALKALYSSLDKELLHHRRYTRKDLLRLLKDAGYEIEKCYHMNLLGIIGWFINGCILKRKILPAEQLSVFNRVAPVLRWFESMILPPIGLSLIVVARKVP